MASVLEKYNREWFFGNSDTAESPYYIGLFDKEGAWYIMKVNLSGDLIGATYATSYDYPTTSYSSAWTSRAGLTYKLTYINTW